MKLFPLLLLLLFSPSLFSQKSDGNWRLTFDEEFNGAELDLSHWAPHDPLTSERGRELQAYSPDAVTVGGGQLHITASRRSPDRREYVSGIATTFGTFAQTYGRFEIRCRVPSGRGLRPGFLLLPVPRGTLPEIDIFETTGASPAKVFFANHWGTEQTERSYGDSFTGPDLSNGFHTIALEWDRERIAWFVDGKEKFQSTDGVPHQPMYLLLDLALEGSPSNLPASFDIDYIRVYQRPE